MDTPLTTRFVGGDSRYIKYLYKLSWIPGNPIHNTTSMIIDVQSLICKQGARGPSVLNASYKVGMSAAKFCRFSFLKEEVKGRDSGTNLLAS
jgi:hypothetical protein